ncbi:MAG: hypothetical protein K0R39_1232 [Symbiobacteriaceae bacterium]|jgi:hypothetical protein|nr:hypothetical protein [Symbiobacteriaceae bacterium]
MILGMTLAIALAAVMMKVGAWLRQSKGFELTRMGGFWVGLVAAVVVFLALRVGTALPQEIASGIAVGLGVGIAQGLRSPK